MVCKKGEAGRKTPGKYSTIICFIMQRLLPTHGATSTLPISRALFGAYLIDNDSDFNAAINKRQLLVDAYAAAIEEIAALI